LQPSQRPQRCDMQVIVLIGIAIAWSMGDPSLASHLFAPGWWTLLALGGYLLGVGLIGRAHVVLMARAFVPSADRDDRRRAAVAALAENLWLLGGSAVVLAAGEAKWVLGARPADWPLAGTLLMLAPFIVALLLMWMNHYRLHLLMKMQAASVRRDLPAPVTWTRGQFIAFNVRTHLLMILVPVSAIIFANDLLAMAYPHLPESIAEEVRAVGVIASVGGVFLLAPLMIVRIWRTSPLEDCALLGGLAEMCRRLHLRYRRILVWRSNGVLVNAGVMGLIAPVRYILLSDGLLEQMPPEQIKAVFAHEAGHVIYHHIFYSGLFMVVTALWLGLGEQVAGPVLGLTGWQGELAALPVLVAAWWLGFGWLSRRFERQSDVVAARLISLPADQHGGDADLTITSQGAVAFAQSLESVARLNGIPPRRFNWRHGSIAARIEYILSLAASGGSSERIDRLVRRVKLGLWSALLAGLLLATVATILGNRS